MRGSWLGSMQSALVATLARPEWWAIALAGFLVRGGLILVVLPIVSVPTTAALMTGVAPLLEGVVLGKPSIEGALIGATTILGLFLVVLGSLLSGSWLDLALVREAVQSEDLERDWPPVRGRAWGALAARLAAHVPTMLALGYALARVVGVSYQELTQPGDAGIPVADRVLGRVPDAIALVVVAWLFGEAIGALAARRAATGAALGAALRGAAGQVLRRRGLATLALTSAVLIGIGLPFVLATERAWEHLRGYLIGGVETIPLAAALVLLVSTWVLGLAIFGAGLAWRATAWTAELELD